MSSQQPPENPELAALRERVAQWRRAEPVLRAQRARDILNADTQASVAWFDGVFRSLGPDTVRQDRGLVEQQRLFTRLRDQ